MKYSHKQYKRQITSSIVYEKNNLTNILNQIDQTDDEEKKIFLKSMVAKSMKTLKNLYEKLSK
jgi:hypothetical protein